MYDFTQHIPNSGGCFASRQVRAGGRGDGRGGSGVWAFLWLQAAHCSPPHRSSLPPLHKHNEWMAPVVLAYTAHRPSLQRIPPSRWVLFPSPPWRLQCSWTAETTLNRRIEWEAWFKDPFPPLSLVSIPFVSNPLLFEVERGAPLRSNEDTRDLARGRKERRKGTTMLGEGIAESWGQI